MTLAQWAEPALLWDNRPIAQRQKPQLLELKSDDFLPEFLDAMNAPPNKKTGNNPIAQDFLSTAQLTGSTPLKLFQPLHSCYYLVTASLVCDQVGFPDKDVNLKKGEKTYFVLRRKQSGVEQGWSDKRGWVTIADKDFPVARDEEQFPAHPVSVCTGKDSSIVPCERKIYYGYIATGNGEKYTRSRPTAVTDPEAAFKKLWEQIKKDDPKESQDYKEFNKEDVSNVAANLVVPESQSNGIYFLKLVYEYDPDCPPILSDQTDNFTFAKFFDNDAPARMIRIEMPSISNMKAFKHGVGIQMPNDLRKKLSGLNTKANVDDLMDGNPLTEDNTLSLGMICTFSIQIIMLIAFIVMFIFAILLNIIFQWLIFLRICFPIPKTSS